MRHIESAIQKNCVRWFRLQYPELSKLLFAVPNGGTRNKREAAIMKAEGITAGVSDLLLLVPNKYFHGLCIEVKTETGRQTKMQKDWQTEVEKQGYKYVVVRNIDDFIEQIRMYLENIAF